MTDFLTIVTVSHNSSTVMPRFLAALSLEQQSTPVIVVDSGSSDVGSTERTVTSAGGTLIPVAQNVGYGVGSNLGARVASASWLAFVNPDVEITASELVRLAHIAEAHRIDCIGPELRTSTSRQAPPAARPLIANPLRPKPGLVVWTEGDVSIVPSLSGCCMVVSAAAFAEVGGFDPRFFMFCEEIDLHQRFASSGRRVAIAPSVVAITDGGGSSTGVARRWSVTQRAVSHVLYTHKHFGLPAAALDVAYRIIKLTCDPVCKPRRVSLRQFISELRRQQNNRQRVEVLP